MIRRQSLSAIAALILLGVACSAMAASQSTPRHQLVYDAADGSLTILALDPITNFHNDPAFSGNLANYVIESPNGSFLPSMHVLYLSGVSQSTSSFITESNPFFPGKASSYGLGNVLPPGLSEEQYFDSINIDNSTYVTSFGAPIKEFNFIYVPEPTSLGALALGSLALLRRRR